MVADAKAVRELFERARDLPEGERAAFLERHCDGRQELRRELESLLDFHARAGEFLEQPVAFLPSPPVNAVPTALQFELEPGAQVGAYVVQRRLGEGGMGVVYLAEQRSPVRRQVALKMLKAGAQFGDEAVRFALESQALALMDHVNVARVFDAGTTADGRPFFALEYVPGVPLQRFCDERRLTLDARLRLFVQVCHGVEHAHRRGIVHRDLKPSNVLVRDDGGEPVPKIIDFGVAKAMVHGLTEQTLRTSLGVLIGTPDYMSPEQARTEGREVDARTDVYALGVVLYELLAGALPYEFRSRRELTYLGVLRALAEEEPQRPSRRLARMGPRAREVAELRATSVASLRAELAADLDWIVVRAIEKERARRYATAAELADDVERVLRHERVHATPPSALYVARKFARRNRVWIAIVAALSAGLLASLYWAWQANRARDIARERIDYLAPLADFARWSSLREESERLWPPVADKAPAMESWIARARDLLLRQEQHAALLARFDAGLIAEVRLPADDATFEDLGPAEVRAYVALIHKLVRGMERLASPRGQVGSLAEMVRRREFALACERASLLDAAEAWTRACASIADPRECPRYGGLALAPQLGLVPIGRDPASGLWEFAHLQTGAVPVRDASGHVSIDAGICVVLVLIPGGTVEATPTVLAPFFLAKHELTQAQWLRLESDNPSSLAFGEEDGSSARDLRLPVDRISFDAAVTTLARARLELPTDAQWQHAARAGTTTEWWTGADAASLVGAANLCDAAYARALSATREGELALDDGFVSAAPIGSFRANPFGLHDVHGNVAEWVQDELAIRGGGWDGDARAAGASHRARTSGAPTQAVGVRPARAVDH